MSTKINVKFRLQNPQATARPQALPSLQTSLHSTTNDRTLTISNDTTIKRRNKYSSTFKDDIDARDREYIIPFQATINISNLQSQYSQKISQTNSAPLNKTIHKQQTQSKPKQSIAIIDTQQYSQLRREIFDFMAEVCENINSISFRLFNQGKLSESEVKSFASKNIIANVRSVLTEIKRKFNENNLTNNKQSEQLLRELTNSIDKELKEIISQLSSYYPQAPVAGGTARMREVIPDVERILDEENDIIFINKINILKYIRTSKRSNMYGIIDQDPQRYTGFIMEVINSAINIARLKFTSQSDQTVFEKFQEFNERLFYTSQHNNFSGVMNKIHGKEQINSSKTANQLQSEVINYFAKLFDQNNNHHIELNPTFLEGNHKQESIQQMRSHNKYAIGYKIPNNVAPFDDYDLKTCNFHVNNSSVLRIMTKWAESLEEIYEQPKIHIAQKISEFKTLDYSTRSLNENDKMKICAKLKEEYALLKLELKEMQQKCTLFQSHILSEDYPGTTYLKRFTEIRSASSQINTILIEFTRKYLCLLIHHLIRAGSCIGMHNNRINLLVFRVGDLLRSRVHCRESSFINLLNTLNLLDQSKEMEGRFKLVRIRNKLNKKDSNVLINYMFLGKVMCELQLSIQEMEAKNKNYSAFNHFLYELTRGKFGVLAQCSIIISQHDPIVNSCTDAYYSPKSYQKIEKGTEPTHSIHSKNENIYKCWKCHQLRLSENIDLFNDEQTPCNQCISKEQNSESKMKCLNLESLPTFLTGRLKQKDIRRIKNYGEANSGTYILSIGNRRSDNYVKLYRVYQHKRELKYFLIEITRQVLQNFQRNGFDYRNIDFFDITQMKEKNVQFKDQTYALQKYFSQNYHETNQRHIPSFQLIKNQQLGVIGALQILNIHTKLFKKVQDLLLEFENFRVEKNIIKSIQVKSQIIDLRGDPAKLQIYNELAEAIGDNKKLSTRFRQCKVLDYKHIKEINLSDLGIVDEPKFLKYIKGYTQLNLSNNSISTLNLQNKTKLEKLYLNDNQVKNMDLTANYHLIEAQIANNHLISVDLCNKFLKKLNLTNNHIEQINLGSCTSLKELYLSKNNLKYIGLHNNTQLTKLYLAQNQLIKIDLSNNLKVKEFDFKKNALEQACLWFFPGIQINLHAFANQRSDKCNITLFYEQWEVPIEAETYRLYLKQANLSTQSKSKVLSFLSRQMCRKWGKEIIQVYKMDYLHLNIDKCNYSTQQAGGDMSLLNKSKDEIMAWVKQHPFKVNLLPTDIEILL